MTASSHDRITIARVVDHMGMGGLQRSVASYLTHHDSDRFRVVVVALQRKPTWPAWRDLPEFLVPVRHTRDTRGIRHLAGFFRSEGVQVVHSHGPFPNNVARQAALLAGTPVVLSHYHSTYENRFDSRQLAWERLLWPMTSRALMVSTSVQDSWQALTRLGSERQSVVWVPVDLEQVDRLRQQPSEEVARALADVPPGCPVLVSASRLFEHKRVDDIIRAVAILKQNGREAWLFVAGDGPEEPSLRSLATALGVAERVRFLGTVQNVPALLARADASILASDEEGFSQLNIEALHCGTPVISTPVGVIPAIDPDGMFVHVVPIRSPDAIAAAVGAILGSREERCRRAEAGRQAVARFDAVQWARSIESLYREELARDWLRKHPPWGYGTVLAPLRLHYDRLRWRWLRKIDIGRPDTG